MANQVKINLSNGRAKANRKPAPKAEGWNIKEGTQFVKDVHGIPGQGKVTQKAPIQTSGKPKRVIDDRTFSPQMSNAYVAAETMRGGHKLRVAKKKK